jgi:hypothetical protein
MENYKTFVTDSLSEYDKNMREQKKILKNAVYYKYIYVDNDIENNKIIFFDENEKKILEADYEIISSYNSVHGFWTWGWATLFPKKLTRTVIKILNYGFSLDSEKNNNLKNELINSQFIISDPIQIDIHLAIASSLSKIKNIYSFILPYDLKEESHFSKNDKLKILKNYDGNFKILYAFLFNLKKFD